MMKRLFSAFVILLLTLAPGVAAPRTIALGPIGFYVANAPLGNDANDGLSAATPKEHYCVMLRALFNDWDFRGNQPFMFPFSGHVFNEMCSVGGVMVGVDALIIAPYDPANPSSPGNIIPSPDYIRICLPPACGSTTPAVQWCDAISDLSILIYYNATWSQCNHWGLPGGAAIKLHNVSTTDIFGPQSTFSGTSFDDSAIHADGPAIITVANGMKINGMFGYPLTCLRDCNATVSGHMDAVSSNFLGWYALYSGSKLNLSVATANYSSTNSIIHGPSILYGGSIVNVHGTNVPGGWDIQYGGIFCPGTVAVPYC